MDTLSATVVLRHMESNMALQWKSPDARRTISFSRESAENSQSARKQVYEVHQRSPSEIECQLLNLGRQEECGRVCCITAVQR